MPRNKIENLRNNLFEVMERLMDDDDEKMTAERAQAISDVAKQINDSAKHEISFMKIAQRAGYDPVAGSQLLEQGKIKAETDY